jgi:hypothetical protein
VRIDAVRAEKLEYISVSSINAFQADRLRWCMGWIENRVPRRTPPALTVGKIVHKAFEKAFTEGMTVGAALATLLPSAAPLGEEKEHAELLGLVEPLTLWQDQFPIERTLEVEEPFEFQTFAGMPFRGRPDRVAIVFGKAFHIQNKTIGAAVSPGTYISLARRSMHELLYGFYLRKKYAEQGIEYGGTIYNVIRKLKYRSTAKNKVDAPPMHTPDEMFLQTIVGINDDQIELARDEMNILSVEMDRTADAFLTGRMIPSTRSLDGGRYGGAMDPYTLVMMGEASLDDDSLFQDREETYEGQ